MGKDPVEARERGESRRLKRRGTVTADWASANSSLVTRAICIAASGGGAIRFGYSQDGGAFAIGIYGDGKPYTEFVAPSENIDDVLEDIIELFEGLADDKASPVKAEKRPVGSTKG